MKYCCKFRLFCPELRKKRSAVRLSCPPFSSSFLYYELQPKAARNAQRPHKLLQGRTKFPKEAQSIRKATGNQGFGSPPVAWATGKSAFQRFPVAFSCPRRRKPEEKQQEIRVLAPNLLPGATGKPAFQRFPVAFALLAAGRSAFLPAPVAYTAADNKCKERGPGIAVDGEHQAHQSIQGDLWALKNSVSISMKAARRLPWQRQLQFRK